MANFTVYKSSAGSGKTYTLVKEYIRLALSDKKKLNYNYKFILAITFTNKAASELKTRILDALKNISDQSYIDLKLTLCKELLIDEIELKKRTQEVLIQILHHYSDFSVGTIDSFTHKIVKTFAFDLKLPVNFNIEMDTDGFYDKVISDLFGQIGEDKNLTKILREFALIKAEENSTWDPEKQIKEFSNILLKENSDNYIQKLKKFTTIDLEKFRKQFIDFCDYYKNFLKIESTKALNIIQSNHLSDSDFKFKKTGPQSFFKKCFNSSVLLNEIDGARLKNALEKNQWFGDTNVNNKSILNKISESLNQCAIELINFIRENHSYFTLCDLLSKQMYPLMLLKKIEEISQDKKQEDHLVFISEFNQKIFEIINNEPAPFIYERLGERFHHYLIDEFQDTSSLQWQNLVPLIDNSLSNGKFNLIVGDGKQSIYRWRNANVNQFSMLPLLENPFNKISTNERSKSLERNHFEDYLETNQRSLKTIVDFNNKLFESLKETHLGETHKKIYNKQVQKIKNQKTGYISVNTEKIESEKINDTNFKHILDNIKKALECNYQYKDICIIARKNKLGNLIANFLIEQKIPVVSSDSLLLKNNLEVNTIICYLKYLLNNHDSISASGVINYLFQSKQISENKFHHSVDLLSKKTSLFDVLKLSDIIIDEKKLSLNNLLDNCIEVINALKLNENGYQYIRFFLDEINDFLINKSSNIDLFFEWWERRIKNASMVIPENTNSIKIMTIHTSKGLEFPVVIIPFCNWVINRINNSWVTINNKKIELPTTVISLTKKNSEAGFKKEYEHEQQEQLLDNLNLLYVAFTRAVERLHIISVSSKSNNFKNVNNWINDFMKKNYQEKTDDYYEIGELNNKQAIKEKTKIENFNLNPLKFDTKTSIIQIKHAHLNNSDEETESAKIKGVLIHWLLSKIRKNDDIEKALNLGLLEGLIKKEEFESFKEKINNLIQHPQLVRYFNPNILCKIEAEILTENGELLRPDRIIINESETIIIDYKTGKENNDKYFRQLIKYEDALIKMGYDNIKKILVYVDNLKIVTY